MMGVLVSLLVAAVPDARAPGAVSPDVVNPTQMKTTWKLEDGKEVALSDLTTEPVVLSFIYTSCTATCPLTTKKLQRLEKELVKEGRKAKILVVSLDPAHDTPAAVADYRKRNGLTGDSNWTILVGPETSLRTLTMMLDFRYSKNPETNIITHDSKVYVLAPGGAVLAQSSSLNDVMRPLLDAVPVVKGKAPAVR